MIRRLFWLTAGAVLGVSGYRKVSRLARAQPARSAAAKARSTAAFVRDVRAGMAEYHDAHPSQSGRRPRG
jgi:hypothetical protein